MALRCANATTTTAIRVAVVLSTMPTKEERRRLRWRLSPKGKRSGSSLQVMGRDAGRWRCGGLGGALWRGLVKSEKKDDELVGGSSAWCCG